MTASIRRVVLTLLCSAMAASQLGAQGHPRYRTYQMGDDVLTSDRRHIDASRAWRAGGIAVAFPTGMSHLGQRQD
jgi:hypothetical protein